MKYGKQILFAVIGVTLAATLSAVFTMLSPLSREQTPMRVYVDADDTADSVYAKVGVVSHAYSSWGLKTLGTLLGYENRVRTGSYVIHPRENALQVVRRLRSHMQDALQVTIPSVRRLDDLTEYLSSKLMLDAGELNRALRDSALCENLGFDTMSIKCMFLPNTYELYWDIPLAVFLSRMQKEYRAFWTDSRKQQADCAGLTPNEVIILASIVDEETANQAEMPDVAGMYINRLQAGQPLQADPTIKYALQDFTLRRIYHKHLMVESPYNTYRNIGLPPGPIRIPSMKAIQAVLNYRKHDYYYMCAKADFSGTHQFAKTYQEHLANAAAYVKALNQREIK